MMTRRLRVGFVINFAPTDPPGRWLGEYMPGDEFDTALLRAMPQRPFELRPALAPYMAEFAHLFSERADLDAYDVLVSWELRTTLAIMLLRRLTRRRRARVIALNPAIKGRMLTVLPLVRVLMRDVDTVVCFTRAECKLQEQLLRQPPDRIRYLPRFAETPAQLQPAAGDAPQSFALALGHSNRDFPTLWTALAPTDIRVTMYRNRYLARHPCANIAALGSLLSAEEEDELVRRAAFHVLPLRAAPQSAGLTILLRAMAHGRAVVVSDTTGIRDYVHDGEDALVVPPGDPMALRTAMLRLWRDAPLREQMGRNAAQTVRERFSTRAFATRLADLVRERARAEVRAEVACAS